MLSCYDKLLRLQKGELIECTKYFTASMGVGTAAFLPASVVPATVLLETMIQSLGWLICYSSNYRWLPVPCLIEDLNISPIFLSSFEARIQAEIISYCNRDSLGKAVLFVEGERIADVGRIIYNHLPYSQSALQGSCGVSKRATPHTGDCGERRDGAP